MERYRATLKCSFSTWYKIYEFAQQNKQTHLGALKPNSFVITFLIRLLDVLKSYVGDLCFGNGAPTNTYESLARWTTLSIITPCRGLGQIRRWWSGYENGVWDGRGVWLSILYEYDQDGWCFKNICRVSFTH